MILKQRPGAPWAFVFFLFGLAPMVLGPVVGVPILVASLVAVVGALFLRTEVTVEFTATRLRLRGWTGRLPRPRVHDLSLHSLVVETRSNWRVNDVPHMTLVLRSTGSAEVIVPVLAVRPHDLARIGAAVDALREEARERHGAGEAEIPDELQGLIARERTPEEG